MIIVTGANGFIGSAFIWELNRSGEENIVAVDSISLEERPGLLKNKKIKKFLLKDEIWHFLKTNSVRFIVHMGACSATTEMDVAFLKENNTDYTKRLWNWCTENQVPFIFASSGAIYGDGQKGFSDESSPREFTALNPYGESKLEVDRWVLTQTEAPPRWYGLRFFNVYGPNEYHKGEMSSVVFKAVGQIRETSELKLFKSHNPKYEDGKQMRDFVYVKDITRWMLELMNQSIKSGIYNMGNGVARTWLDLASATFSSMKAAFKIRWIEIPENLRQRYQYYTEANISKLVSAGLSKPEWPLEKGVPDYVQNYLLAENKAL
jgi:ADP-L-glycero-D-manno-heptose 6-epimerase